MTNDPATRFPPPAAAAVGIDVCSPMLSEPPRARPVPHFDERHDDIRLDEFHWLRQRQNPEVIAYLEAENAWTAASMAHTGDLQCRLYEELVGRIQETDLSVPERLDEWLYYSRTEAGRQYPIYCRRRDETGPGIPSGRSRNCG